MRRALGGVELGVVSRLDRESGVAMAEEDEEERWGVYGGAASETVVFSGGCDGEDVCTCGLSSVIVAAECDADRWPDAVEVALLKIRQCATLRKGTIDGSALLKMSYRLCMLVNAYEVVYSFVEGVTVLMKRRRLLMRNRE